MFGVGRFGCFRRVYVFFVLLGDECRLLRVRSDCVGIMEGSEVKIRR